MSEIPAVLNSKVLIAGFMKHREPRGVSSRWCSEIRNQGSTVINDVTSEQRMGVGEVVIDADHAVVLISGALVGGDQVPGSVPIVCSIRSRNQVEKLPYARINSDDNAR